MRIVGYHVSSEGIIANSDGEYTDKSPYLDFLLQPKTDALKILYYLNQNVSSLAKITKMTPEEVKKINTPNNKGINKAKIPPYTITYIPNRYFALQKGAYWGAPFIFFGDAHQYENVPATECESIDECIRLAKIAKDIGDELYSTMVELGLTPKSLTSPIKSFEQGVLDKIDMPNIIDIPQEAGRYAYECCTGNWVEAFQLGHWDRAYDYDIVSAYPSKIVNLLDTRYGKWIQSKEYQPEADYGYCYGDLHINNNIKLTPFLYRQENSEDMPALLGVSGTRKEYMRKQGIDFLNEWRHGEYKIENGYWWKANTKVKPLEPVINWLFEQREKASPSRRNYIKRIMAAIFGKLLEQRDGWMGEHFNPVWAAEVEPATRLDVARFVLENDIDPIHIAVDGVVSPKIVKFEERKFGGWELSKESPCICAGTGMIAMRDDGVGEFHLKYDWLKEQIERNPESDSYEMVKKTPVTINEACNGKYSKLGELQELKKSIFIGKGEKRCYQIQPQNGGELLNGIFESVPWDISMAHTIK